MMTLQNDLSRPRQTVHSHGRKGTTHMSWTPVEPGSTTLDAVADQGLTGRNVWSRWWGAPHLEFRHQGIIKTPTGVSDDSGQSAAITSFPQLEGSAGVRLLRLRETTTWRLGRPRHEASSLTSVRAPWIDSSARGRGKEGAWPGKRLIRR